MALDDGLARTTGGGSVHPDPAQGAAIHEVVVGVHARKVADVGDEVLFHPIAENILHSLDSGALVDDGACRIATLPKEVTVSEDFKLVHIIENDRPFSDLVLGDYSVVTRLVQHMYARKARVLGTVNAHIDHDDWWRGFDDNRQWREVPQNQLNPRFLADRDYAYDPRVSSDPPRGIPSAGVLTTLNANASNSRERVRAARRLEVFACRSFNPPPADVEFPPYARDPATEGICLHCHQIIDPAAIHFKRLAQDGGTLGGLGRYSLASLRNDPEGDRWRRAFTPDTWMTPVSQARATQFPDARFMDFLPAGQTLFGAEGDGTIGPLGFAKLLVQSGEFDRCALRRTDERFGGRELTLGFDDDLIEELVDVFVREDRSMKRLSPTILARPTIAWGH